MSASKTEICNLAISNLGVGKEIEDIDTDVSQEGKTCRRFYDMARDATFRAFNWPFAAKFIDLGFVTTDPTTEWNFSYRYPDDCVQIRRILSGVRNDSRDTRVSYRIVYDSASPLIYTDAQDAVVEYTRRVDEVSLYPSDFIMAFSFRLAAYMAPRLTSGDKFSIGKSMLEMFGAEITNAAKNSGNEDQPDQVPESEFIRARDEGTIDFLRLPTGL